MPTYTAEEVEFIRDNYVSKGVVECAKFCKRSYSTVQLKANSMGLKIRNIENPGYTQDQLNFIKKNYPIHGAKICAEFCNKRSSAIQSYAYDFLGLRVINQHTAKIEQFLDIKTPEVAYYLGLLWADGTVSKKGHAVSVCMVEKDMRNLECVFDKIGNFKKSIRVNKVGCQDQLAMSVSNLALSQFLKSNDYTIKSGESPDKILARIPESLRHYWWRGYFDGDGNIYYTNHGSYSMTIAGCHEQNWNFFRELMGKLEVGRYEVTLKNFLHKTTQRMHKSSFVRISNKDGVAKFLNYIYKDRVIDGIGLDRKYEKYLDAINLMKRKKPKGGTKCPVIIFKNEVAFKRFEKIKEAADFLNVSYDFLIQSFYKKNQRIINGFTVKREKDI